MFKYFIIFFWLQYIINNSVIDGLFLTSQSSYQKATHTLKTLIDIPTIEASHLGDLPDIVGYDRKNCITTNGINRNKKVLRDEILLDEKEQLINRKDFPFSSNNITNENNISSVSTNTRWIYGGILLGLVGIFFLSLIIGAFCTNIKRLKTGRRPVYGTSWLTPPSYWQSQHDYNTNTGEEPEEYVPTYSEIPNENVDLGFYDDRGEFHLSSQNNEYTSPKPTSEQN